MSAYMLLSTNQSIAYQQQKYTQHQLRKRAKHKKRAQSISLGNSSLRCHDTSLVSSASSDRKSLNKMVYDFNKNQYVPRSSMMSPVEIKVESYEAKLQKLTKTLTMKKMNDKLNDHYGSEDNLLFSIKNLDILRYTYFQQFSYDYDLIQLEINEKNKATNLPKLKYLRKIDKIKYQDEKVTKNTVSGLPSFSRDNLLDDRGSVKKDDDEVLTSESEDHLDYSDDEELISMVRTVTFDENRSLSSHNHESIERIYQEYSTFQSIYELNNQVNIRKLMKSNQFWNDVYQDLKFSANESVINYFDLLPNISHTISFFGDLIDFFLYNIQVLKIENYDGIDAPEDIEALKKHCYFYFKDYKYEFLTLMSKMHHRMYLDQSLLSHNLCTPSNLIYNSDKNHDSIQSDSVIHKNLMNKLIETIMDNLKSSVNTPNRKSHANLNHELFALWKNFLTFLVFEVLVEKDCIQSSPLNYHTISFDNEYPEPTIDDLSKTNDFEFVSPLQINSKLHFDHGSPSPLSSNKLYHPQPASDNFKHGKLTVKVSRHPSVNSSRSITPSNQSVMSSPRSKHKGSFASTLASSHGSFSHNYQPSLLPSTPREDLESSHDFPITPDMFRHDHIQTFAPIEGDLFGFEPKKTPREQEHTTPANSKNRRLFFGRFKR